MATEYAILRMAKRRAADIGGLIRHINGQHRPDSAEKRKGWRPVFTIKTGVHGIAACRKAQQEAKKRPGRRAAEYTEFLFAGPKGFGQASGWSKERAQEWAASCRRFIQAAFPHSLICAAGVHLDENTLHLHVLVFMRDSEGRIGQAGALAEAVGLKHRRRTRPEHNQLCSKLQDRFFADVGQQFGLARGERGSDRQNEPVDPERAERLRILRSDSSTVAEKLGAALALLEDMERRYKALDGSRRRASKRAAARAKVAERRFAIALARIAHQRSAAPGPQSSSPETGPCREG